MRAQTGRTPRPARSPPRGRWPARPEYLEPTRLAPTDLLLDAGLASHYRLPAPRFFQWLLQGGDPGVPALWSEATHFPDAIPLSALLPPAWREPGLARAVFEQPTPAQRSLRPLSWRSCGEHRAAPTPAQQAEAPGIYRRDFAASIHSSRRPRVGGGELAVDALLDPQRIDCGSAARAD